MEETSCEICYQLIQKDHKRSYCNNCGNDYHRKCIDLAATESNQCPVCKEPFYDKPNPISEYIEPTTSSHSTGSTYQQSSINLSRLHFDWYYYFAIFEIILIIVYGILIAISGDISLWRGFVIFSFFIFWLSILIHEILSSFQGEAKI